MNPFENITPPNMDVVCNTTTTQQTTLGITTTNDTQTCSDPWNYYKGYGFDIVIIFTIAIMIKKALC